MRTRRRRAALPGSELRDGERATASGYHCAAFRNNELRRASVYSKKVSDHKKSGTAKSFQCMTICISFLWEKVQTIFLSYILESIFEFTQSVGTFLSHR